MPIPATKAAYDREILVAEATVAKTDITPEFQQINVDALVQEAHAKVMTIPAEYKDVDKELLLVRGGVLKRDEVDCEQAR